MANFTLWPEEGSKGSASASSIPETSKHYRKRALIFNHEVVVFFQISPTHFFTLLHGVEIFDPKITASNPMHNWSVLLFARVICITDIQSNSSPYSHPCDQSKLKGVNLTITPTSPFELRFFIILVKNPLFEPVPSFQINPPHVRLHYGKIIKKRDPEMGYSKREIKKETILGLNH